MTARAIWKGNLVLGKQEVPVKMYSAVQDQAVHFHLLHGKDLTPVEQRIVRKDTGREVAKEAQRKAFPLDDRRAVILEPEELETLEPDADRAIRLLRFVPRDALADAWFDRPYLLGPDEDDGAYFALAKALGDKDRLGIARWVMRDKTYLGALSVEDGYLRMTTLRRAEQVLAVPDVAARQGAHAVGRRDQARRAAGRVDHRRVRAGGVAERIPAAPAQADRGQGQGNQAAPGHAEAEGGDRAISPRACAPASRHRRGRRLPEAKQPAAPVRPFWSGTISFGLVSIPVDLFAAVTPRQKSMKLVDEEGHALGRRYWCPKDEKILANDDLVRGYETAAGKMVVISDEEFASAAPEKSRDIDLKRFVPLDAIPPFFFDRPTSSPPTSARARRTRCSRARWPRPARPASAAS